MSDEIRRKRALAKRLCAELSDKMRGEGRGALSLLYFGYGIRIDKGRYDERLDQFIAEFRAA